MMLILFLKEGEIMKNRLKQLRKEKDLSLEQVGKAVGLATNTISRYETGKREPKLETWQKLADFFGVSVPYLQGIEKYNTHFVFNDTFYKYGVLLDSSFYKFKGALDKANDVKSVSDAFSVYATKLDELKENIEKEIKAPNFEKDMKRQSILLAQPIKYTEQAKKLYEKDKEFKAFCDNSDYIAMSKIYAEYLNSKNKGIAELNKIISDNPILNTKEKDL